MRVENEAFHSIVNIPVAVPQWGSAKGKQGQYNRFLLLNSILCLQLADPGISVGRVLLGPLIKRVKDVIFQVIPAQD